jgi:hypothetical protein
MANFDQQVRALRHKPLTRTEDNTSPAEWCGPLGEILDPALHGVKPFQPGRWGLLQRESP